MEERSKLQEKSNKKKRNNYIPVRFWIAIALIIMETAAVIGIVILCALYIPYFYQSIPKNFFLHCLREICYFHMIR